ncbi:Ecl1 domain-containing protein [Rhizoctonia solani AG-1 IA]|uniref:Ecl1 domain-containing protein n=1 Tax=Thanatephorus cucumeris (strain AG1-IA) TaxID=983506 RepID=L8WYL1_THACA|nr:Ecl1 domain-containing protein [Rhizoctonia solani AG-1 IA]
MIGPEKKHIGWEEAKGPEIWMNTTSVSTTPIFPCSHSVLLTPGRWRTGPTNHGNWATETYPVSIWRFETSCEYPLVNHRVTCTRDKVQPSAMDALDLDTSYCIVCNQFIWPERYQVAVEGSAPAPAPVSPTDTSTLRATKKPVGRTTRTNPQRKQTQPPLRRNASTRRAPTLPPLEAAIETSATKVRTVISQGPAPIYCSDACRSHDVESGNRAETSLKTLATWTPTIAMPVTSHA